MGLRSSQNGDSEFWSLEIFDKIKKGILEEPDFFYQSKYVLILKKSWSLKRFVLNYDPSLIPNRQGDSIDEWDEDSVIYCERWITHQSTQH